MVTSLSPDSAISKAELSVFANPWVSLTTWSEGNTAKDASAPRARRFTRSAPNATAAVVSRAAGSDIMRSCGIFGHAVFMLSTCSAFVITITLPAPATLSALAYACSRRQPPLPATFHKCFGFFILLRGQNLSPAPPAIITAYLSIVFFSLERCLKIEFLQIKLCARF